MTINISLTDFVDFAIRTGPPKLTKVRQCKNRPPYQPPFDYWKNLREAIVDFHRHGRKTSALDLVVSKAPEGKAENYAAYVSAYKKFLRSKSIQWAEPPSSKWTFESIKISVRPELGLAIAGTTHLIKLYFRKDKLSAQKAELIQLLLADALTDDCDGSESAVTYMKRYIGKAALLVRLLVFSGGFGVRRPKLARAP